MNSQSSCVSAATTSQIAPVSQRLLAISEKKRSALILCKAYHAEFAGPGAAVDTSVEQECVGVVAIGTPEIIEVITAEERQKAYSRRIQWIRWFQKIAEHKDSIQRSEKLFSGLDAFFGDRVLSSLSDEILALLVGVLPSTIATVRSNYRCSQQTGKPELTFSHRPLEVVDLKALKLPVTAVLEKQEVLEKQVLEHPIPAAISTGYLKTYYTIPRIA